MEYDLVKMWLRKDPIRWLAGIFAGAFSGAITLLVSMGIASHFGLENWFPIKLVASILLGSSALEIGDHSQAITTGIVLFEILASFLGFVFAHFVGSNSMSALLPMGVVWGLFSWIFLWNLYAQSFKTIYAARVQSAAVFPACIVLGLGMASVAIFDRLFRGGKAQ